MTRTEKKVRDLQIVELTKQGYKSRQLAEMFGLSQNHICLICRQYNVKATDVIYEQCREYKAQGHTNQEVAEHFGIAYKTAKHICKGIAPQKGNNQFYKHTEEEKQTYVESLLPIGFSYVGGYVDCDHKVTIRCKVCGLEFERSMVSIRHGQNTFCPNCAEADLVEKKQREQKQKERDRIERQNQARERLIQREAERQAKTKTVKCVACGKEFSTIKTRKKCCSPECSKKYSNQQASHKKDKRIAKDKRIDRDITVRKLYDRDSGVCWICGGQCDLNDFVTRDNAIICGSNYPSVDHIVPVCEGGEDSWENVRLAHRRCNSLRYWRGFTPPRSSTSCSVETPVRVGREISCPPSIWTEIG